MHKDRLDLLFKIMELENCCVDLNLYLDIHPTDQKAVMDYNTYSYQLAGLKKQYECMYGPLSNFGTAPSQYPFRWIEDPWPWEIEY
ncbi:spore coat protein CotJB [Crassaminicella thermophila]|uniref:Spore coat protein CotJB n=1 Tax=Crassaminicella thermophila TaxID=2599308 RepID=A0A5C0SII1_CRATE|nr:spore coat protein CotJB [Crassaminicella thermophila]QEK12759.1 spore coat protein CotJB [Crassaminicella thermophila]